MLEPSVAGRVASSVVFASASETSVVKSGAGAVVVEAASIAELVVDVTWTVVAAIGNRVSGVLVVASDPVVAVADVLVGATEVDILLLAVVLVMAAKLVIATGSVVIALIGPPVVTSSVPVGLVGGFGLRQGGL